MWDSYLDSDYHSLQIAINRRVPGGAMLKGAYTWSKALNMADDEGWAGVAWDHPDVFDRNRGTGRLRPDAHVPDGLRVRPAVP